MWKLHRSWHLFLITNVTVPDGIVN
jgi:hypothetical protein